MSACARAPRSSEHQLSALATMTALGRPSARADAMVRESASDGSWSPSHRSNGTPQASSVGSVSNAVESTSARVRSSLVRASPGVRPAAAIFAYPRPVISIGIGAAMRTAVPRMLSPDSSSPVF